MEIEFIDYLRPEALAELCALLSQEAAHRQEKVKELRASGQDKATFDDSYAAMVLTVAAKQCAEILYGKIDMDTAIDMLVTANVIADIIIES
jgi:hypothetical protein